jgi:aspartate/methionine/tyrosine aminotransferase
VCVPGYPCYRHILDVLGIEAVPVALDGSSGFLPTPEVLARHGHLDGVVVASPSNPTGTTLTAAGAEALVSWCRDRGVRLVADEIYHGIDRGTPAPTVAGATEAVVVQSFSKYFRMTGWRLGWLVLPDALVRPVERLAQNLYLAPPTLAQHAAVAAFGAVDDLDAEVRRYGSNRDLLVETLRAAGVDRIAPADGAFYVWADVRDLGDSRDLCRTWLEELAVAVTPGVDFDPDRGADFVRFSVAGPTEEVREACDRLTGWIADR